MDEDNPDYLVHEIFHAELLEGRCAGRPILGTAEDGVELYQEIGCLMSTHAQRIYAADDDRFRRLGNLEHEAFVEHVEATFGSLSVEWPDAADSPQRWWSADHDARPTSR